jgi:hypothetical protein
MPFPPAVTAELPGLIPTSASSPSSLPPAPDSSLESESPPSFSLTQQAAEALWCAVEAKAALEAAREHYAQALAALDELVEAGVLPEKQLPVVSGFTIYRQEGRVSWIYPESIKVLEAQVRKRKQLAEQLGEATQKRGEPFWTIKPAEPLKL